MSVMNRVLRNVDFPRPATPTSITLKVNPLLTVFRYICFGIFEKPTLKMFLNCTGSFPDTLCKLSLVNVFSFSDVSFAKSFDLNVRLDSDLSVEASEEDGRRWSFGST